MKLSEMGKDELEDLERIVLSLLDDERNMTLQELADKIGEILDPEDEE